MYLWLNCEEWVRFGPFTWLRFDDDPRIIRDRLGQELGQGCGHVEHVHACDVAADAGHHRQWQDSVDKAKT